MHKFVPWFLAISLILNIYLAGTGLVTSANPGSTGQQDMTSQVEQLQERVVKLQQEKQALLERIQELKPSTYREEPEKESENKEGVTSDKTYSWYFVRNKKENAPPRTDPLYQEMLENRGYFLGDTSKKQIYLTFDEGYESGYTERILDILKANNVKAAFFVTGGYVKYHPELVKRIAAEGHIIGNHSYNHPSMPRLSNEKIRQELSSLEKKVKSLTGEDMKYFRPPRGEFNQRVLDVAAREGYTTVFWSMAYQDWLTDNQPGKEAAYNFIVNNIHNGAIILLHAVSLSNAEALDSIIKELKDQGYTFATLEQL